MKNEILFLIISLGLIAGALLFINYEPKVESDFDKHEKLRRSEMRFYR